MSHFLPFCGQTNPGHTQTDKSLNTNIETTIVKGWTIKYTAYGLNKVFWVQLYNFRCYSLLLVKLSITYYVCIVQDQFSKRSNQYSINSGLIHVEYDAGSMCLTDKAYATHEKKYSYVNSLRI